MAYLGKVYPMCALSGSHVPAGWDDWVAKPTSLVRTALREQGIEVLNFAGLRKGSPTYVYKEDFESCVPKADLGILLGEVPSFGAGGEAIMKLFRYFKNLAIFHPDPSKFTWAFKGLQENYPDRVTLDECDRAYPQFIAQRVATLLAHYKQNGPGIVSRSPSEVCVDMRAFLPNFELVYGPMLKKGLSLTVYDPRDRRILREYKGLPPAFERKCKRRLKDFLDYTRGLV